MAIQHELVFPSEAEAKTFQEKLHINLKDVVSLIDGIVVIVIDGKVPPQTTEIERLAKGSSSQSIRIVR